MTVVWAGPIVGVIDPLLAWLLVRWLRKREPTQWQGIESAITFLAGFCLLANGAYLGLGWIDRVGDTGVMMRLGTPVWLMVGFGVLCAVGGFALWHQMGPWLGLKQIRQTQTRQLVLTSLILLAIGFILDWLI
jgi:hypothetical protein